MKRQTLDKVKRIGSDHVLAVGVLERLAEESPAMDRTAKHEEHYLDTLEAMQMDPREFHAMHHVFCHGELLNTLALLKAVELGVITTSQLRDGLALGPRNPLHMESIVREVHHRLGPGVLTPHPKDVAPFRPKLKHPHKKGFAARPEVHAVARWWAMHLHKKPAIHPRDSHPLNQSFRSVRQVDWDQIKPEANWLDKFEKELVLAIADQAERHKINPADKVWGRITNIEHVDPLLIAVARKVSTGQEKHLDPSLMFPRNSQVTYGNGWAKARVGFTSLPQSLPL